MLRIGDWDIYNFVAFLSNLAFYSGQTNLCALAGEPAKAE
jgi:hypothetical protein